MILYVNNQIINLPVEFPFSVELSSDKTKLLILVNDSFVYLERVNPKQDIQTIFTALEANAVSLTLDLQND